MDFQFNIDGTTITGASGGDAASAGLMISNSSSMVIAFSLTGTPVSAGCGTFVNLDLVGEATGLSNLVFSDSIGGQIPIVYYVPGEDPDLVADCTDEYPDCAGNEFDCASECGGSAEVDECGTCDSDSSNDCVQDCAGTWGGSSVYDECGVCDGNNSACADCAGVPNGDSWVSDCGCVASDNSGDDCDDCAGIPNGDTVLDCAGECGGFAVIDECGECAGDGIDEGTCDCDGNIADCFGECGGFAVVDECGECGGDGIDEGACDCDANVLDCTGECAGTAEYDECGICDGENTDQDCNGDCFGNAYLDECDECVGGNTGVDECSSNVEVSLNLHAGANLVSFYAIPEDNSLYNTMYSLDDVMIGIIGEGLAANLLPNGTWVGSLSEITTTSGYWIKIEDAASLLMSDAIPSDPELAYDLHAGANLISYPSDISMPIGDAISSEFYDYINGVIGEGVAASLLPNGSWAGSLTYLDGGKGYWFKVSEDFQFHFNIADEQLTRSIDSNIDNTQKYPKGMEYNQSIYQAFYFIENILIDNKSIEKGSWILAYNENVLVGARKWMGQYTDVPAMGYDFSIETSGYLTASDDVTLKVLDLDGDIHVLQGDIPEWTNNELFHTGVLTNLEIPDNIFITTIYPNPFNPSTNIEFTVDKDMDINIDIYDINGRLIENLVQNNFSRGIHSVNWDASMYPSGIYFVKIISENISSNQKLILMK